MPPSAPDVTLVRGGVVVDGLGSPARRADVLIEGGRITAVGPDLATPPGATARTVDADGRVVAPGFIDIHTHYDGQVFWDQALTPSCFHGVTTVVAGNCGFGLAPTRPELRDVMARTLENVEDMDVELLRHEVPWDFETFPDYLRSVRRTRPLLNFTAYLGHTPLRLWVMGMAAYERAATDEEIAQMRSVVRASLDAGARGLATSYGSNHRGADGRPVPSRLAEWSEFVTLCDELKRANRGVIMVTPESNIPESERRERIRAVYELQRAIGRPATWSTIMTKPSGVHRDLIALNDEERAAGADVWPQVSPLPLSFQISIDDPYPLNYAPSLTALMTRTRADRAAAYADAGWRATAIAELESVANPPRWSTFVVAESPSHPELEGRLVAELAEADGRRRHPFDVILDLAIEDDLRTRIQVLLQNDEEDEVAWLLAQPGVTLGPSDAGAHVDQICDAVFATHLLGRFVREREALSLEHAVHKLTGEVAAVLGLHDRGRIAAGAAADVVVFDPASVGPGPKERVRDFPGGSERLLAGAPTGVHNVFVNGVEVVRDNALTDEGWDRRPGIVLGPS